MSNNTEYIKDYNKTHYKQFKVQLKPDEYKTLEKALKIANKSKIQFVREAIMELDKKVTKIK